MMDDIRELLPLEENDDMTIRVFGPERWAHPSLDETKTPVGHPCFFCGGLFTAEDQGVTMTYQGKEKTLGRLAEHRGCVLRSLGISERKERIG